MTDPNEIANAIDCGGIIDYDGELVVRFLGRPAVGVSYSVDDNVINFPYRSLPLTDWLRGLHDDKLWSVEWVNR